jgi:iron(III) transport system ATP-binding protein
MGGTSIDLLRGCMATFRGAHIIMRIDNFLSQETALVSKALEILGLHHAYGAHVVVRDLSLSLAPGEIGALLGASGCGKTTVLRCVAGFEAPQRGEIRIDEQTVTRPGLVVPPERRRIGMVFQDHALFPHLTIAQNVAFGLRGLDRRARANRVAEMLDVVGLSTLADAWPHQLSGGQRQRAALARALAPQPALLLLDEPFSSLDEALRARLAHEVRALLRDRGMTALVVTHDQHEAFAMADAVGLMHEGRIEQWGSPEALYRAPATRYAASFVGEGVFLRGRVSEGGGVETALGRLPVRFAGDGRVEPGASVEVLLRPEDVRFEAVATVQACVVDVLFRGAQCRLTLRLDSGEEVFALAHEVPLLGERVGVSVRPGDFPAFAE